MALAVSFVRSSISRYHMFRLGVIRPARSNLVMIRGGSTGGAERELHLRLLPEIGDAGRFIRRLQDHLPEAPRHDLRGATRRAHDRLCQRGSAY